MTAASSPNWVVLAAVIPLVSCLLTAGLLYAAFYPHIKDRRAERVKENEREERIDVAVDLVLGKDAEPKRGHSKIVGLVDVIPLIQTDLTGIRQSIGQVNGSGKTVMGELRDARETVERIGVGQVDLASTMDRHIAEDEGRFQRLEDQVGRWIREAGDHK